MQIDIFRELTGILDSCEGVDPFSERMLQKILSRRKPQSEILDLFH